MIHRRFAPFVFASALATLLACSACEEKPAPPAAPETPEVPQKTVSVPAFDADRAYGYVAKQVGFGPRIPNTAGHRACAQWMAGTLEQYGAKVTVQEAKLTAYDGTVLQAKNIIASFNPDNPRRVLLCAHWDTRPFSDNDPNPANRKKPFLGADDGGSGVAVLLEIARHLQEKPIGLGVDIVLFDAEDYGDNTNTPKTPGEIDKTWCLGSQHWAKNPHKPGYRALWGILLDMVGAQNARFPQEANSLQYNPVLVRKVWQEAQQAGYGGFFVNQAGPELIDDHLFVNSILNIPTIDIINVADPSAGQTFGSHWHTQADNLSVISKSTLQAVGQTVLAILYKQDADAL
jgi:hypothetical protein